MQYHLKGTANVQEKLLIVEPLADKKEDVEGIENIYRVYLIVLVFYKMKAVINLRDEGTPRPHTLLARAPPQTACFYLYSESQNSIWELWKRKQKTMKDQFQLKRSIPIYAVVSNSKICIKIKTEQNFVKSITAWSTYPLKKLVCIIYYESGD